MKPQSSFSQAGLTLLEMVIGLSVIVLVLVLTTMNFDQTKGRAQSLEAKMQLVRAGVLRFQMDLPCGPAKLSALTVREDAAVGLCGGTNNLNNWHGPYMDSGSAYVNSGDVDISSILPGSGLSITKQVANGTMYTILKVSDISNEMHSAMIALCDDDCTPYKQITGKTDTIGLLISQFSLQALNQGTDVVAFGVTPPVLVGAGPVISSSPPIFTPPGITSPASTIAPYAGPGTVLVMTPPSTRPPLLQQASSPPPPPPPPPPKPAPGISVTVSGYNVFPSVKYPTGTIFDNLTVSGHFQVKDSEIRNFNANGNQWVNTSNIGNFNASGNTFVNKSPIENLTISGNFSALDSSITKLTSLPSGGGNAYLKNTNIQNLDWRGYTMNLTNLTINSGRVESPYGNDLTYSTIEGDSFNIVSGVVIMPNVVIKGKNMTIWGVNYGPCEVEVVGGTIVRKTTCPGGVLGFDRFFPATYSNNEYFQ